MMKFFRKHNKKLLAVFMVLLMVVFLGGSAVEGLLRQSANREMALSRFGPITSNDYARAQNTTEILGFMGLPWDRPVSGAREPLETIDWILLSKEAEELGTVVPIQQIRATLDDYSVVDNLARRLRRKPERILQALAEFNTVRQTALTISGAATPSQSEVVSALHKVLEKVRVNAVVLPSVAFIDDEQEFTEQEIQAQFEEYRERERSEGLEFGYYVHPALKVQYIKIDQKAVADKARIANLENRARAFYNDQQKTNPAFRRPPEQLNMGTEDDGPVPEIAPYLTWEESRDKAVELVREEAAKDAMARMADWLVQYSGEPWYDSDRGDDGYKAAPEQVKSLGYYDGIVGNMPRTIAYPEAISTGVTDFFSEAEADTLPVLGSAFFVGQRAGVWETLKSLAFRSKPIIEKVPNTSGINPSDYLSTFQTSRYPLRDQDGNTYVFRVVDSRPGHVAESVAEVRDKVIADLRVLRGYEEAKARAESLRSCGSSMTLREAYESDEELVATITNGGYADAGFLEPQAFPRSARFFATSGQAPRPYMGAGIGEVPLEVLNECFALTDREDKSALFELKDRAAVMVVEWAEILRPDAAEFDKDRVAYHDEIVRNRSRDVVASWLNPDNIRARNGFTLETN